MAAKNAPFTTSTGQTYTYSVESRRHNRQYHRSIYAEPGHAHLTYFPGQYEQIHL
uniref:Uncharacterized protein n=1 Tax=Arundo donax TaxID=35708 RepID=A0A0A9ED33_ARUDO